MPDAHAAGGAPVVSEASTPMSVRRGPAACQWPAASGGRRRAQTASSWPVVDQLIAAAGARGQRLVGGQQPGGVDAGQQLVSGEHLFDAAVRAPVQQRG